MSTNDRGRQAGLTLVELVVFIVVLGIGVGGILLVLNVGTQASADPAVRKQVLAIAESLLEEVELMPFSFCDPDDPNAATATGPAGCTVVEAIGPEGESRYAVPLFDNVNDYHGFDSANPPAGIRDITGAPAPGLNAYRGQVTVQAIDLNGITQASGDALLITVTVSGPNNVAITLQGIRTRHAPTATL